MRIIGHRPSRTFAGAVFSGCLAVLSAIAPAQAQNVADEFVTERTFFRTHVNGKAVRLDEVAGVLGDAVIVFSVGGRAFKSRAWPAAPRGVSTATIISVKTSCRCMR